MEIYKNVGLEVLDQTQPKLAKVSYNPCKEVLMKELMIINDKFSQVCGVTLTLRKKFHDVDPKDMHRMIHERISSSRVWHEKKYILIPEFTKNGILHMHGVIYDEYQTIVIKLVNWWRRTYGFAKIELKINNYKNWTNYILKDYGKTGLWTIYNIK